MYEIKKLNVLSMAKIQTFLMMASYLIWAILVILLPLIFGGELYYNFFNFDLDLGELIYGPSMLTLLVGLIIFGIIGFIAGVIIALLYNLIASWIGGIKMDIILTKEKEEDTESQEQTTPQG